LSILKDKDMHRTRTFSSLTATVLLFALIPFSALAGYQAQQIKDIPELQLVDRVGQCALYRSGKVRVILLQGTPYQIGYAEGKLLSADIRKVVTNILFGCKAIDNQKSGFSLLDTLEVAYRKTLPHVPARYREELRGMADGSGMDLHSLELANIFPELFHCSVFTFMNKATKDGKLIHGRVLDYMIGAGLQDYALVMVVKSTDRNTIMLANYTGFIGCVTGMNDQKICVGMMGMGCTEKQPWDGVPMTYLLRHILEEYNNLSQAGDYLVKSPRTCEYAYVISDGKIPDAIAAHAVYNKIELFKPGQAHPLFPTPLPDTIMVSANERYKVLVERTRNNYGKIDLDTVVEMIKCPLAMKSNLHDAIMIPADNIMYLADALSPNQENFQACYQPYYKHDLNRYKNMMAELAKKYKPTMPASVPVTSTQPAATSQPTSKPATINRSIGP
jgi:isopenicillin-N N-acyltransferase-like protein